MAPKLLGQVQAPDAASSALAMLLGLDVVLYRSAADVLKTDDSLVVSNFAAIGQAALQANERARITAALTDAATTQYGARAVLSNNHAAAAAIGMYGLQGEITITGTGDDTGIIVGLVGLTNYNAAGIGSNINGQQALVAMGAAAGGISTARGSYFRIDNNHATNAIVNANGLVVASNIGVGPITNNYGMLIQAISGVSVAVGLQISEPANGTIKRALDLPGTSGNPSGGITFGGDVELYRRVANVLATNDALQVQPTGTPVTADMLNIAAGAALADSVYALFAGRARFGHSNGSVMITDNGTSKSLRIELGAAGNLVASLTTAGVLALPLAVGPSGALLIGGDANLYRSAADKLKTDDALDVAGLATLLGGLKVPTGAVNGYVMRTDASGNGSWGAQAGVYYEQTSDPGVTVPGTIWNDTDDVTPTAPRVTVSTTAPASPNDGDEWIYVAEDSSGTIWRFRYRAGAAHATYKWEFVGGTSLRIGQSASGSQTTATTGTFTPMANLTPFTIPFDGYYNLAASGGIDSAGAGTVRLGRMVNGVFEGTPLAQWICNAGFLSEMVPVKPIIQPRTAGQTYGLGVATNNVAFTIGSSAYVMDLTPVRVST